MAIILGLIVALTYGSGDFFGGQATKKSPASAVVIGSFCISTICLIVATAAWAVAGDLPHPAGKDLVLGAATGFIGPISLGLLYRGLATGRMSVVAPTTAVVAAIVPFVWGIASGERPGPIAVAGAAVALVAVALISGAPAHEDMPAPAHPVSGVIPGALASGFGFGVIFIMLGSTSADAGLWPLLVARPLAIAASIAAITLVSRRHQTPIGPALVPVRDSWSLVAGAGILDVTANATYIAATQRGLLSIVAVLSSLYPAATVLLARVVLHERLHRVQVLGLVLAAAGIVAMTAT